MTTTPFDEGAYRDRQNRAARAQFDAAVACRGYAVTTVNGQVFHAAVSLVTANGGYLFPRALCQRSTTTQFHGISEDPDYNVNCERCLASPRFYEEESR